MRERLQKRAHAGRFFVLACAVAGTPLAGSVATFTFYNRNGASSSLSRVKPRSDGSLPDIADTSMHSPDQMAGPGPSGVDFVPVLSLQALLDAVPTHMRIAFLKIDAQGFDLNIVRSARMDTLRRVDEILAETYLPRIVGTKFEGVENGLREHWIPYMRSVGFQLTNPPENWDRTSSHNALFAQKG